MRMGAISPLKSTPAACGPNPAANATETPAEPNMEGANASERAVAGLMNGGKANEPAPFSKERYAKMIRYQR